MQGSVIVQKLQPTINRGFTLSAVQSSRMWQIKTHINKWFFIIRVYSKAVSAAIRRQLLRLMVREKHAASDHQNKNEQRRLKKLQRRKCKRQKKVRKYKKYTDQKPFLNKQPSDQSLKIFLKVFDFLSTITEKMVNTAKVLQLLICPICLSPYNTSFHKPIIICKSQRHLLCEKCLKQQHNINRFQRCFLCRQRIELSDDIKVHRKILKWLKASQELGIKDLIQGFEMIPDEVYQCFRKFSIYQFYQIVKKSQKRSFQLLGEKIKARKQQFEYVSIELDGKRQNVEFLQSQLLRIRRAIEQKEKRLQQIAQSQSLISSHDPPFPNTQQQRNLLSDFPENQLSNTSSQTPQSGSDQCENSDSIWSQRQSLCSESSSANPYPQNRQAIEIAIQQSLRGVSVSSSSLEGKRQTQ